MFRSTRIVAIRHAMKLRMMQAPARPETLAAAALPSPSRLPMRIVVARPTENGTGKSEATTGCEECEGAKPKGAESLGLGAWAHRRIRCW